MRNYHSSWRLIPLLEASGEVQMAVDRWLLQQHRQGQHPPTLRFYTWSPVAISLGYHQRRWPTFWQELTWQGKKIDLVRRPTGGRAVLHQGDLTYMVVTSGIPGKQIEVYEAICRFLIHGWRSLGLNLHYGDAKLSDLHNPNCFSLATGADLVTPEGQKLIGSAQLRQGKAILQHGSILLSPERSLFEQVFAKTAPEPVKLSFEQQGDKLIQKVLQSLTEAASHCFKISLVTQPLSEDEWTEILLRAEEIGGRGAEGQRGRGAEEMGRWGDGEDKGE